jgi:50S ribosomal protein L16 3-hydroxylase
MNHKPVSSPASQSRPQSVKGAQAPKTAPGITTSVLAGMTPATFMAKHWQRKPALIRQAVPQAAQVLSRQELFALAERPEVESRLIQGQGEHWHMRSGPLKRRALPPIAQPNWTLLVQGVDQLDPRAYELLQQFRFLPDARLDDIMISWASEGGGVGPHFDSYDVFLLQLHGKRQWRIGRQTDLSLKPDMPLKILADFQPERTFVLEPGDMLYLPPNWAHDGTALGGDCMTLSVGFKAPARAGLAAEVLLRMAEMYEDEQLYTDKGAEPTAKPGEMPNGLLAFAQDAVTRLVGDPKALACALGEVMTEPKPNVYFHAPAQAWDGRSDLYLSPTSRMLYDKHHVFINGESFQAAGLDAKIIKNVANKKYISVAEITALSGAAHDLVLEWYEAGWLYVKPV